MSGILLLMLLAELAAFVLYREYGVNRLYWVPVSFALVALAGGGLANQAQGCGPHGDASISLFS